MLYLIRHTDAVDLEPDAARPLSAEGRDQVKRMAHFLRGSGEAAPEEVWHSPFVRARETAAGLAKHLGWKAPLQAVAGLLPDDDPSRMVARLNAVEHGLAEHFVPQFFNLRDLGEEAMSAERVDRGSWTLRRLVRLGAGGDPRWGSPVSGYA